jgi:hypothetical protein
VQINADAARSKRVSGSPVNGSFPPGFDGGVDGGGLSNVTPSTVGDTEGVIVRPPGGGFVVVPPLGGGVVVPPPGGGLVGLPLAGHALLLGLVVGKAVLAVNGTTRRLGSAESGLGVANGMARGLDDGLPSALAVATTTTFTPRATVVLSASTAIARNPGSLNFARVTQVTAHNPVGRWEKAVKRAGALRSRHRRNPRRPDPGSGRRSCMSIERARPSPVSPHRSSTRSSSHRPSQRGA